MTVTRYDVIELKASVTPEGWIRDRPVITRSGIFDYKTPDGKTRREYRPDAEVFQAESMASCSGIPITDSHRGLVNAENVDGIVGTVTSHASKQDEIDVVADVVIHNPKRLGKKRELSLGYVCDIDDAPGEINGQRYDCVQRNIRYNHLAVVNKGRAGNAKLRLDSSDAIHGFEMEGEDMADTKLVAVRLDGIDYQASPEVSNALDKGKETFAALQRQFDAIEAERDGYKVKVADHEKQLADTRAAVAASVRARMGLEEIAKLHVIKLDEKDTTRQAQEKVLGKLRPELKLDGRSDDYIASAFDLAVEDAKDKSRKVSGQLKRFDVAEKKEGEKDTSAAGARQRYLQRLKDGVQAKGSAA